MVVSHHLAESCHTTPLVRVASWIGNMERHGTPPIAVNLGDSIFAPLRCPYRAELGPHNRLVTHVSKLDMEITVVLSMLSALGNSQ